MSRFLLLIGLYTATCASFAIDNAIRPRHDIVCPRISSASPSVLMAVAPVPPLLHARLATVAVSSSVIMPRGSWMVAIAVSGLVVREVLRRRAEHNCLTSSEQDSCEVSTGPVGMFVEAMVSFFGDLLTGESLRRRNVRREDDVVCEI